MTASASASRRQNIYVGTAKSLVPPAHTVGFERISTSHATTFGSPLLPGLKSAWHTNYRISSPTVGATALIGVYKDQAHAREAYSDSCSVGIGACTVAITNNGIRMKYAVDTFSDGVKLFSSFTTCRNLDLKVGVVGPVRVSRLRRLAEKIATGIYAKAVSHGMTACIG
jgi:hypothetical protein